MISPTIGRIPVKLESFFQPLRALVRGPVFRHLWGYTLACATARGRRDVKTLHRWLPAGACRQNITDFLIAAPWDPVPVLEQAARTVLRALRARRGERLYLIIDPSKKAKRGAQMEGAHKFYVPMGGRAAWGHEFVQACLRVGDVVLPWAVKLYAPPAFARSARGRELKLKEQNLNELAAAIIQEFPADLAARYRLVVLFDAGLFNQTVTDACDARGFTYVSRAADKRVFWPETCTTRKQHLGAYGPGVLRYQGQEVRLATAHGQRRFRVAARDGRMRKAGDVRVVFSARATDGRRVNLVTNDRTLSAREVVVAYAARWSIEELIKQLKQHLGLGDYRTSSFTGVVRHLHLVCLAHLACTHLALRTVKLTKPTGTRSMPKLPRLPTLQDELRRLVWNDHAARVRRRKNGARIMRAIEEAFPNAG